MIVIKQLVAVIMNAPMCGKRVFWKRLSRLKK